VRVAETGVFVPRTQGRALRKNKMLYEFRVKYKIKLYMCLQRLPCRELLCSVVPQGYSSTKLNNFCSVHYYKHRREITER
jgi:hypothetical protein